MVEDEKADALLNWQLRRLEWSGAADKRGSAEEKGAAAEEEGAAAEERENWQRCRLDIDSIRSLDLLERKGEQ